MMFSIRLRRAAVVSALTLCSLLACAHDASALAPDVAVGTTAGATVNTQDAAPSAKREEIDLEIHLQLLVGSNKAEAGVAVPASLDATVKQLRTMMQLPHYRLGPTFLHRVKSGRNLEVKGTGGLLPLGVTTSQTTPTFYNFTLRPVELRTDESGRSTVSINDFRIGMKVPIVTATITSGNSSTGGHPVIQYEDTGIATGLSIREGEPVVVGTIYVGPEGDAIVVVLTAKRIGTR